MHEKSRTFVTFAYGSNMLTRRVRDRCPSSTPLGVARLDGHELRWHKRSADGSGKCDVVEVAATGSVVFGVLFQIEVAEKPALDSAEGLGNGYEQGTTSVTCNGESRNALIYVATAIDDSLNPYTWYKALVVAGAREHCLPGEYVAQLEIEKAVKDANAQRHTRNMAMVNDSSRAER